MGLENLFRLIRSEEVVLWAGAGVSMYAGYPSGNTLREMIIHSLTDCERSEINEHASLAEIAEDLCRFRSNNRNSLIKILSKIFVNSVPTSTIVHQKFSTIPHFKSIITTNYDTLFESTLGSRGQVVFSSKTVPYIDNRKTQIFKAHGDLSDPDSVIITKSDYNNFFINSKENDEFWTVIRERLATKSILFLGYNLDDPNVSVLFEKITSALASNRNECFFIAPPSTLPQSKKNFLLSKNIQYFELTAEEFIDRLIDNIKDNIVEDLEANNIGADTFRRFLASHDVSPELKGDSESYRLSSMKPLNENVQTTFNFTLQAEKEFLEDFNDFLSGRKVGSIEVPNDKIRDITLRYGGIKFPEKDGLASLVFQTRPKVAKKVDIRFSDGFELSEVLVEVYGAAGFVEIHLKLKMAKMKLSLTPTSEMPMKAHFTYEHNKVCSKVREELEFFNFLKRLGLQTSFTVFDNGKPILSNNFPEMVKLLEEAEYFLLYFENLKKIENHFGVQFDEISIHSVTKENYNLSVIIVASIEGADLEYEWNDHMLMELENNNANTLEQLKTISLAEGVTQAFHREAEIIDFHGVNINLGYKKIQFLKPYIENLDKILSGEETTAIFRSQINRILISYDKEVSPNAE